MNKIRPRHNARRYALQALYQWHYTQDDPTHLLKTFMAENRVANTDVTYFKNIVLGSIQNAQESQELLTPCLDRKISALNPVELSILLLAVYELRFQLEIPYRIIIDEALELSKEFGAESGYKYINAVLDGVRKKLRPSEK